LEEAVMTLSTRILIAEPTNPKDLFLFCLDLLKRDFNGEPQWEHKAGTYNSSCGQGLAAWVFVHYAQDGPLQWGDPKEYAEYGWPLPEFNEHLLNVDFDTAYGYRSGPNEAGCSDLHAWLVQEVGRWLAAKNITRWGWRNEFTGEWFGPDDDVLNLGDPVIGELPERIK